MKQKQLVGSSRTDPKSTGKVGEPGVFNIIEAARQRGRQIGGCWSGRRLGDGTGSGTQLTAKPEVTLKDLVAV